MSDTEREIVAEYIVSKPVLKQFVDTLTPLVDECRLNLSDEGFTASVVDPANVASIIPAKLNASGFEHIDAPGNATQGINLKRLDDYIGKAKSDDLIQIRLDMKTRKLLIDYREIHHSMGLIDPDAVRKEPSMPDLELSNTVGVSGSALSEAVDVVDLVTDHIEIRTGDDSESITFVGEGDVDDAEYTIDGDALLENDITDSDAKSLFSIDILKDLVKPIPDDSVVSIEYGTEFPIRMVWETDDGDIEATQLLAPRIQNS